MPGKVCHAALLNLLDDGSIASIHQLASHNLNMERSKQIEPSLYEAPADPPDADNDDLSDTTEHDTGEEEVNIPVLPSVRQLANKFQILNPHKSEPTLATSQVRYLLQAMMTVLVL